MHLYFVRELWSPNGGLILLYAFMFVCNVNIFSRGQKINNQMSVVESMQMKRTNINSGMQMQRGNSLEFFQTLFP